MTGQHGAHPVDPVIIGYVTAVANRFGAGGLEDLITLASAELTTAKAALAALAEPDDSAG